LTVSFCPLTGGTNNGQLRVVKGVIILWSITSESASYFSDSFAVLLGSEFVMKSSSKISPRVP